MYKKILLWGLIGILVLMTGCQKKVEEADTVLFTLNGEPVDVREGKLYLELTRQAFEEKGGKEVWSMSLQGRDPSQTATDKALESLIRTKVLSLQIPSEELTQDDQMQIIKGNRWLIASLGTEMMEEIGLSQEEFRACMEESYRAWKYRDSMERERKIKEFSMVVMDFAP